MEQDSDLVVLQSFSEMDISKRKVSESETKKRRVATRIILKKRETNLKDSSSLGKRIGNY